jgi:3-phenylpropionate/trans-cinnamate dioxygenase ferredoxin reductase subunit
MESHIIIVGAGQAALQASETLRSNGYEGKLTVLGDEPHLPYHRPPLSKAWLAGDMAVEQLAMRAEVALERKNITIRTSTPVSAIDTEQRVVRLVDGTELHYTGLLLATGATPRQLPCVTQTGDAIRVLRSRDDASAVSDCLKRCADSGLPVVVVGGGFIGLEVAATARKLGLPVTVLEAAPRLLGRVLAPVLSDWYAALHRGRGVELVFDARIEEIRALDAQTAEVRLADGKTYRAGLVLVGIGVTPNDILARAAGIACDNGIIVDACGRTSAADVYAAGDCTARKLEDGTLLRLESVQNAVEQGRSAAASLLGQEKPFTAMPWFWSDQYEKKLQIAGLSHGADQWVVRGELGESDPFAVYHFRVGRLVAVDTINSAKEHLAARTALTLPITPTPEEVASAEFDLPAFVKAQTQPVTA